MRTAEQILASIRAKQNPTEINEMRRKEVEKRVHIDDHMLKCKCGSINLHQRTIGIYNCHEDQSTGTHVEVDWDKVTVDKSMVGNPSPRRHGISISFECEQCGDEPILNIYQHKGTTYMEWEVK